MAAIGDNDAQTGHDLIARLRNAADVIDNEGMALDSTVLSEAADEIDRLRELLREPNEHRMDARGWREWYVGFVLRCEAALGDAP